MARPLIGPMGNVLTRGKSASPQHASLEQAPGSVSFLAPMTQAC